VTDIRPGQVYVACDGSGRLIRVLSRVNNTPGLHGFGKVDVETMSSDGRGLRFRAIEARQLHATAATRNGQPRRTGYHLTPEETR
jgi:hypothetical protein